MRSRIAALPFFLTPTLSAYEAAQAAEAINDASRLNETLVSEIVDIRTEHDVTAVLVKARLFKKPISIAGRRHSMGGQTFQKNAIVLNMLPFHGLAYDASSGILTAQAGATWAQIQALLDAQGRSVWVMQSDNVFTVGGTVSVNAHGWQPRQGAIASTVDSFRMMLASGEIKTCSRLKNRELFRAALGGYGLLGVILDVRLKTVPNKLYAQTSYFFPAQDFPAMFEAQVKKKPGVELAYGRLSINKDNFLTEAGLHTFTAAAPQPRQLPAMEDESMVKLKKYVFQRSAKTDAGKRRRWALEKQMAAIQAMENVTRNTIMHPDFSIIWNPLPETRDILQEYFVPYGQMNAFIQDLRRQTQAYGLNLLNVTLRDVPRDADTLLAYAKTDMCALVLFFSQPNTAAGEHAMRGFTSAMVDRAIALDGSFYLPYRLHYAAEQFHRAYPQAAQFADLKKHYDPEELFSSQFFLHNFASKP